MGDKLGARRAMIAAGVPVAPGSDTVLGQVGRALTTAEAAAVAQEIGYPVMVKAAAGGGGRWRRR
jgi:biotin carboxylase